jgi:hypothetical protein
VRAEVGVAEAPGKVAEETEGLEQRLDAGVAETQGWSVPAVFVGRPLKPVE